MRTRMMMKTMAMMKTMMKTMVVMMKTMVVMMKTMVDHHCIGGAGGDECKKRGGRVERASITNEFPMSSNSTSNCASSQN